MGDKTDFVNGLISGGLIGIISIAIIYVITGIISVVHNLLIEAIKSMNPIPVFIIALLMLAFGLVIVFWIRLVRFIHQHTFVEEL